MVYEKHIIYFQHHRVLSALFVMHRLYIHFFNKVAADTKTPLTMKFILLEKLQISYIRAKLKTKP